MRSLKRRLDEHLEKVQADSESIYRNHWLVEIRAFRGNIEKNEAEARRLEALCGEKDELPKE